MKADVHTQAYRKVQFYAYIVILDLVAVGLPHFPSPNGILHVSHHVLVDREENVAARPDHLFVLSNTVRKIYSFQLIVQVRLDSVDELVLTSYKMKKVVDIKHSNPHRSPLRSPLLKSHLLSHFGLGLRPI